jgi:fimbrial chaperone protein
MNISSPSNSSGTGCAVRWARHWLSAALGAATLLTLLPAMAADLGVDPVSLELSPDKQTAALKVSNASDLPTSIQIQAVAWSQQDGKDVYAPTKELLVAPPIVTIAPNSEQIIRVALRRPADPVKELTYRIFLQELPVPPPSGYRGLQVALRIGLPVFVKPAKTQAVPNMVWSVAWAPDHSLKVTMQNQGAAHVQVSDFELFTPGIDKSIAGESGSSYMLAGQSRSWSLKADYSARTANGRMLLKAYTDAGNIDVVLIAGNP